MEPGLRLHHIGYIVADIPAAAGEWERRFGYSIETGIIEDPHQTALVQFLRLPGASHWLELVSPNGPLSKLSNALSKGEGLHHLCYETDDLEASVTSLRSHGMFPVGLPVPGVAFGGRKIAWFLDRRRMLVELVETGPGPLLTEFIHSK